MRKCGTPRDFLPFHFPTLPVTDRSLAAKLVSVWVLDLLHEVQNRAAPFSCRRPRVGGLFDVIEGRAVDAGTVLVLYTSTAPLCYRTTIAR